MYWAFTVYAHFWDIMPFVMPLFAHFVCVRLAFHFMTFARPNRWNYPSSIPTNLKVNLTHVRTYARVCMSNCLIFNRLAYISICMQSHFSVYPFFKPLVLFFRPLVYIVVDKLNYCPTLASWNNEITISLEQSPSARYYRLVTIASKRQQVLFLLQSNSMPKKVYAEGFKCR